MSLTWNDIEEKIKSLVADALKASKDKITLETKILNEAGVSSRLDLIEVVVILEEEFKVEIPDNVVNEDPSVKDILGYLTKAIAESASINLHSKALAFRIYEDGKIHVGLQTTDGTWVYADGTTLLPAGIYLAAFSKWGDILKELEDIINSPATVEQDLQRFFEEYPELLKGDEYNIIIPQARILTEDKTTWRADFVLHPLDQTAFCKILELKLPQNSTVRQPRHAHLQVYSDLISAINQLRDYGEAFHSTATREKFKEVYNIEIFKPDLQLIAGRKWDIMHMRNMLEVQRRNNIRMDDWDTCLQKLRRRFT